LIEPVVRTPDRQANDGLRIGLEEAIARILVLFGLADEEGRVALSLNDKTPPLRGRHPAWAVLREFARHS
jgi:hypothetical protein